MLFLVQCILSFAVQILSRSHVSMLQLNTEPAPSGVKGEEPHICQVCT